MTDRPILFSGPMVRALLAGTKTQTRRLINPQPPAEATSAGNFSSSKEGATNRWTWLSGDPRDADSWGTLDDFRLRYATGDRLYVREAHSLLEWSPQVDPPAAWYWADGNPSHGDWTRPRPSIHMPRWASRLTLTVTDVRVQRLQEITNEDCIAEGVPAHPNTHAPRTGPAIDDFAREHGLISHYGAAYMRIWEAVNGKGSWDANPFVAAYSFRCIPKNIDTLAGDE